MTKFGTRVRIVLFWLLFLLFCALLVFAWSNRVLWLGLLPPLVLLRTIKPWQPPLTRRVALLFRVCFVLFFTAAVAHALNPFSSAILAVTKVLAVIFAVPVGCCALWLDALAFAGERGQATQTARS